MKIKTHQTAASRESGVRRRSTIPTKVHAACTQIRRLAAAVTTQVPVWDISLFERIAKAPPAELTDELLTELRQTRREVVAAVKACEDFGGNLEQAITRVKRVLKLRKELKHGERKRDVHEEESVEVAFDPYEVDEDIEIEVEDDDEIEVESESGGG